MILDVARIMTTSKQSTPARLKPSEKINISQASPPHISRTFNRDWGSLLGLLLLAGLTGFSAFIMVVDVAALRQTFQLDAPSLGPYETAEQVSR